MKSASNEKEEFKHKFVVCTCEMCIALKLLVALVWVGTYLFFVYHILQATAGASVYGIVGAICYVYSLPTMAWALGAWLDHREPKKS